MNDSKSFKNLMENVLNSVKKTSYPRENILKILFYNDHLSVKEIQKKYEEINKTSISTNSIYNLLNLLKESNLIKIIEHKDEKRYELNIGLKHDHLICIKCKNIVEFTDPEITKFEDIIGKKYDFKVHGHILLLEGICEKCQKKLK